MNFRSLLGAFQTQPDQFQTLLGDSYDPKTARMKWLGGTLQGLGLGLASGQPGAWATGLTQGGGQAVDDYRKQAMQGYQFAQAKQDQDWQAKQRARQESQWASEDQQAQQMNSLLGSIDDPMQRLWAQTDPKGYFSSQFGPGEMKVVGDAIYDTKSGNWITPPNGGGYGKPKLPAGYRMKEDGTGAEPIPGVMLPGAPKPYTPGAGDRTAIRNAAEENAMLQQTLKNLDEASGLVGNTNSGFMSAGRATVAENLPDIMVPDRVFGSPKQGADTLRFKQIMDAEALASMGKLLKGPTSDRDVKVMLETVNDPNASVQRKQASIDRVRRTIEAQIAINNEMMAGLKDGSWYGQNATSVPSAPLVTEDGYTIEPVE